MVLETVDLSRNEISGSLPEHMGKSIKQLDLSSNCIRYGRLGGEQLAAMLRAQGNTIAAAIQVLTVPLQTMLRKIPVLVSAFAIASQGSIDPPTQYPISPWPPACGGVGLHHC